MKIKDVVFVRCEEYNPLHPKSDVNGFRKFWRADYEGKTIATLCDTKAECMAEVRNYIRRKKG